MPKPEYPLPGEAITSAWAKQITDFGGEKWRFIAAYANILNNIRGGYAAKIDVECTNIPANNATIKAVDIGLMVRDAVGTGSWALRAFNYGGSQAGVSYTSGVTNKGGYAGNFRVKVGGANNRWIQIDSNAVVDPNYAVWLWVFGYWIAEN